MDEFWCYAWGKTVASEKQSYVDVSATSAAGEPMDKPVSLERIPA